MGLRQAVSLSPQLGRRDSRRAGAGLARFLPRPVARGKKLPRPTAPARAGSIGAGRAACDRWPCGPSCNPPLVGGLHVVLSGTASGGLGPRASDRVGAPHAHDYRPRGLGSSRRRVRRPRECLTLLPRRLALRRVLPQASTPADRHAAARAAQGRLTLTRGASVGGPPLVTILCSPDMPCPSRERPRRNRHPLVLSATIGV